jgi:hypothetical protein
MVFKTIKKSSETKWELTPITSLLTEQRKFDACTSHITASVPFLSPLLGGSGPCKEDEKRDSLPVDVMKEESDDEDDLFTPVSAEDMKDTFNVPSLNKMQQRAAFTFLNSEPNTITLIQGWVQDLCLSLLVVSCFY